jgi:hypothetical protein
MRETIAFHLDGLRTDGVELPEPHAYAAYCDIAAWCAYARHLLVRWCVVHLLISALQGRPKEDVLS